MAEKFEKLFDQFAPVTPEEWRAKAEVDLKGADYNKRMIWRTNEGFNVEPLYRGVDIENLKTTESLPGEYPFVRGTRVSNDWYVRQDIDVTDVKAAYAKALEILNKGINNVGFNLPHGQIYQLRPIPSLLQARRAIPWRHGSHGKRDARNREARQEPARAQC